MKCQNCGIPLRAGDVAYASDWKVIDIKSTTALVRIETRYTCEPCEENQ